MISHTTPGLSRTKSGRGGRFEPSRLSDPMPPTNERRMSPVITLMLTVALLAFATYQILRPDKVAPTAQNSNPSNPTKVDPIESPPEVIPENNRVVGNIPPIEQVPVTEAPVENVDPPVAPNSGTGDCVAAVSSDPGGAKVLVNGRVVGSTPAVYSGVCATSVTIRCELDGYADSGVNIFLKNGTNKHICKMREVPKGILQVIVNINTEIYVGGEKVAIATANQPMDVPLLAGRKYTVRFVNPVLGIDQSREFSVERGKTRTERLNFNVDR